MPPVGDILYVEVPKTSKKFDPGNWLFHTGSWTVIGELTKDKTGTCRLWTSSPAPVGKTLDEVPPFFVSVDEALNFLSKFYGVPVRRAKTSELPKPTEL